MDARDDADDLRAYAQEMEQRLLPFLAAALAVALFSLMDALMKGASILIGAYSALLFRSIIGSLLMFPVWKLGRGCIPLASTVRMHALRGTVNCGMALLFFYGLVRLPIAEAIALSFIAPLIALYLAAILLGERIGQRAILASILGFAGVVLIALARLDRGILGYEQTKGVVAVLASAGLYGWNLVLQRKISQIAKPTEIALAQQVVVAMILLLPAPWLAIMPDWPDLVLIAISAVLATLSLLLLGWAYARAETQALIPAEYSGFLWAALFGWIFFAERIAPATLGGALLIITGCWVAATRRAERAFT
jgi:S-adenosylmethionine uptake transporter